jgi:hypothetical protein
VDSVIFRVLERLPARLWPQSVVLTEIFPPHCSGCLPTGKVEGVPACWAGNDGLTVSASCWSISAGRYRCFEHPFFWLWVCHGDPWGFFVGSVLAHEAFSNCTHVRFWSLLQWMGSFYICLVLLGGQFCRSLGF